MMKNIHRSVISPGINRLSERSAEIQKKGEIQLSQKKIGFIKSMCTEEKTNFSFKESSRGLLDFVKQSPTSFHAVKTASSMLEEAGFIRLAESSAWNLEANGKYYVTRNGSSLIAFCIPEDKMAAFRLFCSHTDSPSFKVKEGPQLSGTAGYTK